MTSDNIGKPRECFRWMNVFFIFWSLSLLFNGCYVTLEILSPNCFIIPRATAVCLGVLMVLVSCLLVHSHLKMFQKYFEVKERELKAHFCKAFLGIGAVFLGTLGLFLDYVILGGGECKGGPANLVYMPSPLLYLLVIVGYFHYFRKVIQEERKNLPQQAGHLAAAMEVC